MNKSVAAKISSQSEDCTFHLLGTKDLDDLLYCLVWNSMELDQANPIAKLTPQDSRRILCKLIRWLGKFQSISQIMKGFKVR